MHGRGGACTLYIRHSSDTCISMYNVYQCTMYINVHIFKVIRLFAYRV